MFCQVKFEAGCPDHFPHRSRLNNGFQQFLVAHLEAFESSFKARKSSQEAPEFLRDRFVTAVKGTRSSHYYCAILHRFSPSRSESRRN